MLCSRYAMCFACCMGGMLAKASHVLSSFPHSNSDKREAGEKLHRQARQHLKVVYRAFKHHQHQTLKTLQVKPGPAACKKC